MRKELTFREIRYNEKRGKILETAARLFANKGYENVTLEEIAAKLKLTRASLYYYVKSKDHIFYEIQMQAIEQGNRAIEEAMATETDPVERLRQAIINHVRLVTRDHIVGLFRQREVVLPPKLMKEVEAARSRFEGAFQVMIREGIEAGVFRIRNWKLAVKLILGTIYSIPLWYSPRGELSAEEIGENIADFILKGFGCDIKRTGRKADNYQIYRTEV